MTRTLPKLPRLSAPEIVNGRSLYTVADLRAYAQEYGQACFDAGRASVNPPFQSQRVESDVVNDLMGMMGMKK